MSHDARMPEITPEFTQGSATFGGSCGRPGARSLLEGVSSCRQSGHKNMRRREQDSAEGGV
eukprot:scaffold38857_cov63-Phaeocystis_antarctica.AAC.1